MMEDDEGEVTRGVVVLPVECELLLSRHGDEDDLALLVVSERMAMNG